MDEPKEYRRTTIRDLIDTTRKYMDDNRSSRDVNERWLADYLIPVWKVMAEVGNNRLGDTNKSCVQAFRAAELEAEIDKKRQETEGLERELKKVRAA